MPTVRLYRDQDFEDLQEVRDSAITRVNIADYSKEQVRAWRARPWLRKRFENRWAWVAELNGRLAGFIDLTPEGLLDRLYVHADFQRIGAAQALYDVMEAQARRAGLARLEVEASHTARGFFERQGFEVEVRQALDVDGVAMDNWRMSKALSSPAR